MASMFFCLASGAAFGAMAVFGKLAYAEGATVGTLLALRFLFASGLFWVGTATTVSKEGQSLWRDSCRVKGSDPFILRRDVLLALGLGAGGASRPEHQAREGEADREEGADGGAFRVGELAEHGHRAERGAGGEAIEHGRDRDGGKTKDRLRFLRTNR